MPRKYGKAASTSVKKAMKKRKKGTLKSGSGGKVMHCAALLRLVRVASARALQVDGRRCKV